MRARVVKARVLRIFVERVLIDLLWSFKTPPYYTLTLINRLLRVLKV